ncbi:hypothetical protein V8G54_000823 [Vigna mungo]|uniref:Transposase MuDR plant domain-containing protein n=1 Tax=Vigna mungo TaxID=3915 RepID=A0AAQ3SB76_VIGMU
MHDSGDGECEQGHGECQEEGDGECEQGTCSEIMGKVNDMVVERCEVPVSEERHEGDDVVEGQIEVECDVGQSEGDDADVRSWSSSSEDTNVDCNVDVNDDCVKDLVDYSDVDDGINIDNDRGLSDDNWESEELFSGGESHGEDDEEESYGKFVTFSMPKTMVDYKWELGTYFADKQDILDAIKTYAIENGRNLTYVKNDTKRIRIKCMGAKENFPWMAYCAYMNAVRTWQLRTIVENHSCSREHKVKLLNSKWLSKRLEKTVKENPKVKGVEIRDKISRKWTVGVSRSMTYRGKAMS